MDFSPTVISDRLRALTRAIDTGGAGKLRIYNGTPPAPGAAITTEVKLAELTFPSASLDNVTGSTLTLANPAASTVIASGTASWGRIVDGSAAWVADMTVSIVGGGGECQINNGAGTLALYAGGNISLTLATLVET